MNDSFRIEVEKEYRKIDEKWLTLHSLTSLGVLVLTFTLECFIGYILYRTGEISTTIPRYMMKFLVIPSLLNTLLILIEYKIIHSARFSQETRIYTVSLLFVIICFIIFTVHSTFTALYFIFAIPILLTAIYRNYKLSALTTILSLIAVISSELFIPWDADKASVLQDGIRLGNFIISLCVLASFFIVSVLIIYFERIRAVAALEKELERHKLLHLIQEDELTGLYNRVALRNALGNMEEDESDSTYTFVMMDIDNFKLLNDTLGHMEGDNCLKDVSKVIRKNCGRGLPFRYGGDEFCILFKDETLNQIKKWCGQIQMDFKDSNMKTKTERPLTISIGIASYTKGTSPSELIKNSDTALYQSKIRKDEMTVYNDR